MLSSPNDPLLDQVGALLRAEDDVIVAFVFGSIAAGEPRPESDIDVAVFGPRRFGAGRRADLIRKLGGVAGRPVDLVDLRSAGVPLLRAALRDGRCVVSKDRRAFDYLHSRMLLEAEDFLPYRERMLRERRKAWMR